ncbi:MAG: NAD(P)H-dependent oxidoreductase [Gemmatimonadales bacterium]|nr:NAD(P)H-dependent oxidoreductase [Gemmatimonadales bacterium]
MTDNVAVPVAFRVLGIPGSLRSGSFNRALLEAARELAPPELIIEVRELTDVPLFNQDLESDRVPAAVRELRSALRHSDGLLLVTPEYNHGVPGVLKNAIDWLSQPPRQSALEGKPTALMGASTGLAGTARSQSQLRQAFVLTNSPVMQQPEVLVGRAPEKFDTMGRLTDQATRQFVTVFLTHFVRWLRQQKRAVQLD